MSESSSDEIIPQFILDDDITQIPEHIPENLIHNAIRCKSEKIIKFLIENDKIQQTNFTDSQQITHLMLAVEYQRFDLIPHFLSQLDNQDQFGTTALMRAIEFEFCSDLSPLLKEKELQDHDGITALMLAAMNENVSWFCELKSEITILDNDDMNVIQICKMRGLEKSVVELEKISQ